MVFVARSTDCPAASAYGPLGSAADSNMATDCNDTADCDKAADCNVAAAADVGIVMVLESNVTAAVRANSRPSTVAPVVTVIEAKARMFPLKTEPVPRVAELPTCQKMWAAWAPPLRMTWRPAVVVRVDAIWKMKTAFALPWASSVRSPDEIGRASCRERV